MNQTDLALYKMKEAFWKRGSVYKESSLHRSLSSLKFIWEVNHFSPFCSTEVIGG
jgi:hypothetical protein